ncbi:universal stress protein [Actinokineospora pegani]|uniref:universal stress protein n=1 Tax=Actinokineospora pegani TaxID=2654637 RepID=UPI0012E99BED|nr:universal stress protein [Actinokineospora pegani]
MRVDERAPQVVVGHDGSDGARHAVDWAALEAAQRGVGLAIVECVDRTPVDQPPLMTWPMPPTGTVLDERAVRDEAEDRLATVAARVRQDHPGIEVTTAVASGPAAETLPEVAGGDDVVVVGSSGRGAVSRALLGSTASELLRTCDRPLVVVRGTEDPAPGGGRVVVGTDGACAGATEFAFDFAARHGLELVAVHTRTSPPGDRLDLVHQEDDDPGGEHHAGERLLDEALAEPGRRHPGVPVHRVLRFDAPADALADEARHAALLVVGSHGVGPLRSLLTRSVSHAVVHHAPCPVAVVRTGAQEERGAP